MDLDLVHAQWMLDLFPARQIPEFAAQAMMQGFDGPNILELASFHRPDRWDIKPEVFEAAIREMGRQPLSVAQAALRLAREVALRILRDQASPVDGATEIGRVTAHCGYVDAPKELIELETRLDMLEAIHSPQREHDQAIIEWAWDLVNREPGR